MKTKCHLKYSILIKNDCLQFCCKKKCDDFIIKFIFDYIFYCLHFILIVGLGEQKLNYNFDNLKGKYSILHHPFKVFFFFEQHEKRIDFINDFYDLFCIKNNFSRKKIICQEK